MFYCFVASHASRIAIGMYSCSKYTEPLKEIVQDPGKIYKLDESKGVRSGIDEAIKTALEAIVLLENKDMVYSNNILL